MKKIFIVLAMLLCVSFTSTAYAYTYDESDFSKLPTPTISAIEFKDGVSPYIWLEWDYNYPSDGFVLMKSEDIDNDRWYILAYDELVSCYADFDIERNKQYAYKLKLTSTECHPDSDYSAVRTMTANNVAKLKKTTVYVSINGKYYHKKTCKYYNKNNFYPTDKYYAKKNNYKPCKVCYKKKK